jgi:nicotinamidase-related amidase
MPATQHLIDDAESGSSLVLLVIDMINGFDFPNSEPLRRAAEEMAPRIAALAARARACDVPVVYVNDNFGRWRSDFRGVLRPVRDETAGAAIAARLVPDERDYFVLKPRHSGFLDTSLGVLLDHLGARRLVLTGVAGDLCVLFTAIDAHMRDYQLVVPDDCVASCERESNDRALALLRRSLGAETPTSGEIRFTPTPHSTD